MTNVATMQHRRFYGSISMNESAIANVIMMQRRRYYIGIPMDVFDNINTLMVQRRRCCSFDSLGLARNEPTLGEHSQGDSTPSVLSFFEKA
ncbi:MAG: tetrahydrofolate synthase [Prevotella salivae]|uniref:tetrahydrofolate synthase n=1 Tax=Segatella salivae TaxID=228604 RepID=UPI001CB2473B|nr:tetrahydrofolate synthase [Segatella salivae]MBF1522821.1 tetrahydrofolate synthase [Segatella salivae]